MVPHQKATMPTVQMHLIHHTLEKESLLQLKALSTLYKNQQGHSIFVDFNTNSINDIEFVALILPTL